MFLDKILMQKSKNYYSVIQPSVETLRLKLAFLLHFVEPTRIIWNAAVFYAQNQDSLSESIGNS